MDIANSLQTRHQSGFSRSLRIRLLPVLSIFILLTSCQSTTPLPVEIVETSINSGTAIINQTTATPFTIITPTITPEPSFSVNSQCPTFSDVFPKMLAHGVISYSGRFKDYRNLLNLETGQKSIFPVDSGGLIIVSQDGNKIAYSNSDPNTLSLSLAASVLDTKKNIEIPWPFIYSLDMPRWQNSDQILFTLKAEDNTDPTDLHPYRNALVNPFTNETKILNPDFPQISDKLTSWNSAGSVVYDQTLEYAVYASWNKEKNEHEYVFWHIPSHTKLAVLPGNSYGGYTVAYAERLSLDGVSYNPPVWSTDDNRVAVISSSPNELKTDEIFTTNKNGDIELLTEFFTQLEEINIRTLSWSPNGGQIAFFITTGPGPLGTPRNEQLAILDVKTRQVIHYCIDGDVVGTRAGSFIGDHEQIPAPLWSPDGSQVIIENRYEGDDSRLILLDIPSNTAYEIGQNMQPIGWMISGP